ncbi:hypothetical protein [Brunnivagina elsteri]|uniref:Uncharacterized protein n=1 Tax=Brunnivagina elsteri CCALA 953 TaxID=987040 RepID=A0A2A2TLU6_9CYAN|nr:hypothetical protein [Calothrix elsteri]PAX58455.1 hypothetical protein CK510_07460 [Calothrix elsteri CCALA 953]
MQDSLIALALAIACTLVVYKFHLEIVQLAASLMAIFWVGLSFIYSPFPVEILVAIAFIITVNKKVSR